MKKPALILLGCAVLGVALWLGLRSKPAPAEMATITTEPAVTEPTAPEPARAEPPTNRTARVFSRPAIKWPKRLSADVADSTNASSVLDAKMEEIIASDAPEAEIGKKLLELYPSAPAEQQADLALEIASRTSDKDYGKLSNILTNSATPEDVVETLLTDLLDRPDKLRLPLLLDMARLKDNPKSEDARDLLEALLGQDYGEDWSLWSKKISEWLASHPE